MRKLNVAITVVCLVAALAGWIKVVHYVYIRGWPNPARPSDRPR